MEQDWKQIIISDFSLGLTPKYWVAPRDQRTGINGEHSSGSMNPLIYPGYLSPGSSSHTSITNIGALNSSYRVSRFISVDDNKIDTSSGTSIYAGNGPKLHAINPTTNTIQNSGLWPHTIIGTVGDTSTRFDVTNPAGTTYRYTYDGTGTDPGINSTSVPTGISVRITNTNLAAGNRGTFTVTGSGTNYFEVTNASGVVESDKTISSGSITFGPHSASGHVTPQIDDIVEYQLNGTRRVFYFFRDDTDGDAGIWDGTNFRYAENIFSSATNGFVLSNQFPIIPVAADNSFMYIANGNVIHKFDGTTDGGSSGTVTANVVKASVSRTFVDMADGLGKLWIASKPAYTSSTTPTLITGPIRDISIIVWNRTSTIISLDDNIPINDCTDIYNIFFHRGVPFVFTLGSNKIVQLRKYDGRKFTVVQEVGQAGVGRPANRGAIQSFYNGILWQDLDGRKFWYGTMEETLSNDFTANKDDQLFMVGKHETITSGSAGAMFRKSDTNFYVDFTESSTEKIALWSPLDTSATVSGTEFAIPYIELPQNSVIHGIKLLFLDFSGGASTYTIDVYKDAQGSATGSFSLSTSVDGPKGYFWMPLKWRDTNRIMFKYSPPSVAIDKSLRLYRIEVYFTPTSKLQ